MVIWLKCTFKLGICVSSPSLELVDTGAAARGGAPLYLLLGLNLLLLLRWNLAGASRWVEIIFTTRVSPQSEDPASWR